MQRIESEVSELKDLSLGDDIESIRIWGFVEIDELLVQWY